MKFLHDQMKHICLIHRTWTSDTRGCDVASERSRTREEFPMRQASRWTVPMQFAALALVWGASFLFMKIALEGLSAIQVVFGRLALGSLVLAVVMASTRRRWPPRPVQSSAGPIRPQGLTW